MIKQEYISLHTMRYYDIMVAKKERLSLWKSQKSLSTRVLHSGVIPTQASGLIEATTSQMPHIESGELADCIRKYGKILMGLFHRAITFTIRMATRLTTHLITLSACRSKITMLTMSQLTPRKSWQSVGSGSIASDQRLPTRINQKRVEHGIENLAACPGA